MNFWTFTANNPVAAVLIVPLVATAILTAVLIVTECIRHSCLAIAESKRTHD